MGKGRVLSSEGEGLYNIEILEDRTRSDAVRTLAQQRIDVIDSKLIELGNDLAGAQADVDAAANVQNQAITAYRDEVTDGDNDSTEDLREEMARATEKLVEAARKRDLIAGHIQFLKVERLGLQKSIDRIDALPALRQQQAWCADYTLDQSGEIGTVEIPGQAQQVLMHPGHDGAASYNVSRDGALQPSLSGTPAGVFYNLAMLPGWQKWKPTYRIATITSLDLGSDLCAINVEPAESSEQGLNVNAESIYTEVPIQYMTCNAAAFEEGDRVLVRFNGQSPDSPVVVGFESSPRPCEPFYTSSYSFSPFSPHPAGIDWYNFEFGPDPDNQCSGTSFDVAYNVSPNPYRIGTAGTVMGVLHNDIPLTKDDVRIGNKYRVDIDMDFATSGYSFSSSANRCVTTFNMGATIQEGDPLANVCVASLQSIIDVGFAVACYEPENQVAYAEGTPTLHNMSSIIEIDTYSLDLQSLGIRVANTYRYAQDSVTGDMLISARLFGNLPNDIYGIEVDKDRRGVIYLAFLFESAPMVYSHVAEDGPQVLENIITPMTAAFVKSPDGTVFRVQARGVAPENQMPDYETLATGIEKNESGNWVEVF